DPFGALIRRRINNADTNASVTYYYIGPDATINLAEGTTTYQSSGHILLGGVRIASSQAGTILYYHRDRLGRVVATSVSAGKAGAAYRYTPYGAIALKQNETPANASDLGYTGALTLTGGLIHLNSRVYDPGLRRFLQPDTIDLLRYTYTNGDPINRIDPTG